MTKEDVLIVFDKLLDTNQDFFKCDETKEQLLYRLAYNNGLIDMRDKIIIYLSNETGKNEASL